MSFDDFVSRWPEDDRKLDRSFALNQAERECITKEALVRIVSSADVLRDTAQLRALQAKKKEQLTTQFGGHSNLSQILAGIEKQISIWQFRSEIFLRYFSIPRTLISWFEVRELGIVGWAVEFEGQIVRIFMLRAEDFPQ